MLIWGEIRHLSSAYRGMEVIEGHSLKTASTTFRLAKRLGLLTADKEAVWYGFFLQDVECKDCSGNFGSFFPSTDNGPGLDMMTVDTTWAKFTFHTGFSSKLR